MKIKSSSTSDACQDDFVLKMLDYPDDGYFVDLGSGASHKSSNSLRLEEAGWNGICVDMQNYPGYSERKCKFFVNNALQIDYYSLLKDCDAPEVIDYLSLDIDEYTTELLKLMPLDKYQFKIITIEHDAYLREPEFRLQQRYILNEAGYYLLCADVWPDSLRRLNIAGGPFEDWWVKKEFFSEELLTKMKCENLYGSKVVNKFGLSSFEIM